MDLHVSKDLPKPVVKITLSERNLLAGLHKLQMEGSARTLVRDFPDGTSLILEFEPDEEHYADRKPGIMHSSTERYIIERKGTQKLRVVSLPEDRY